MSRTFQEHIIRKADSLDGFWRFSTDPDGIGEGEEWFKSLKSSNLIAVPSVWNEESGLLKYEGIAWYEKDFYTEGGCIRLAFDAVMTKAKVWLDGVLLGEHYGGFSAFEFLARDVASGKHRLTLSVDNRFDDDSIPQRMVDWYHYGGIIRSVSIEVLNGICVLNNRFEYSLSDDFSRVDGRFVVDCYNAKDEPCTDSLSVKLDGETVCELKITLDAGERKNVSLPDFGFNNVRLWDIGVPELYNVEIKTSSDDLLDRVGIRKIEVKNKKILLNGRSIEIRGINRHEEYPGFGFAFPKARMKHDVDLVKDLGCNAIRGSHYPNSREFVDLADEYGIIFWSEIPIWGVGFSVKALANETILERGIGMHKEMVSTYFNHPSIIFWGMHNEIQSDTPEGLEMSKRYYSYLKENGGNRLVVYASCKGLSDISFEYTDVFCLNMYFGWYNGEIPKWDSFIEEFCQLKTKLGRSDLPIIFSEFGAAALYGFHDAEASRWSEEYQATLLEYCLKLFHRHPEVAGAFVWQFADIRTCAEMGYTRARGYNNKGVMNEHRRPKAAYYAVQKCYKSFAEEEL